MFTKNPFTQKDPIADLIKPMLEAQTQQKIEELRGNQKVLDKNKNNKLDSQDFEILRGEKKAVKENNLDESSLLGGYTMKQKHSGKYRIHAPNGEHVGDITKEPGPGKWRHHAGGPKWDGTETSPHYKTGVSNNIVDAAKKVAEIHKSVKEDTEELEEGWDDMIKASKERRGPQPSGGSGVKLGSRYGGGKQKDKPEQDDDKKKVKEDVELDEGAGNVDRKKLTNKYYRINKKMGNLAKSTGRTNINTGLKKSKSDATKDVREDVEQIDEVSLKTKIKAYGQRTANAYDSAHYGDDKSAQHHSDRADKIKANITKHHGPAAAAHAEKHATSKNFPSEKPHGRGDPYAHDTLKGGLRSNTNTTKAGKVPKGTQKAMKNKIMPYDRHRDISGPKGKLPEEVEQMDERSLTPAEKSEMERNVKGMKKNLAGFKQRYGERAKSVMYATATKQAKKG